jgi:hypothetical protein
VKVVAATGIMVMETSIGRSRVERLAYCRAVEEMANAAKAALVPLQAASASLSGRDPSAERADAPSHGWVIVCLIRR